MLHRHQHTLAQPISCTGKGLHTGRDVHMRLLPAAVDHGIVFKRTDLPGQPLIPARYDHVVDTRFCTAIGLPGGASIATIEHLMSALAGLGVDNALIEIDAPEVPVMDGSAEPFVFLLECAGLAEQPAPRRYLRVLQPMQLHVQGNSIEIEPDTSFVLDITIDFSNPLIGRQQRVVDFGRSHFKNTISRARTFGFAQDVDRMREAGLALGGSLENAIVVGDDAILNPEGLRYQDEFVRHKMLDCLGDLYLAGRPLLGRVKGYRIGHAVNNMLLHALFDGEGAVEETTLDAFDTASAVPLAAMQAGGASASARL